MTSCGALAEAERKAFGVGGARGVLGSAEIALGWSVTVEADFDPGMPEPTGVLTGVEEPAELLETSDNFRRPSTESAVIGS
mmetsp:Transcript_117663/g.374930  ORF Transcript_117663/g.374930 Transcript_117663/m.374930 type:complete len:81 (-) Transcript_117663:1641-1883(-)